MVILFLDNFGTSDAAALSYELEANAFHTHNIETILEEPTIAVIDAVRPKNQDSGRWFLLRGSKLTCDQYARLSNCKEKAGYSPIVTSTMYDDTRKVCHWFHKLQHLCVNRILIQQGVDPAVQAAAFGWGSIFIQDRLRMEKVHHINLQSDDFKVPRYTRTTKYGIWVCNSDHIDPKSIRRFFVIDGQPVAVEDSETIPVLLAEVNSLISSRFYSVDVVTHETDGERVLGIDDGQTTDLKYGWTAERLASAIRALEHNLKSRDDDRKLSSETDN